MQTILLELFPLPCKLRLQQRKNMHTYGVKGQLSSPSRHALNKATNDTGRNEREMRNNELIWPRSPMLPQEGHNRPSSMMYLPSPHK